METIVHRLSTVTVRREGPDVVLLNQHGKLVLRLPWEAALRLGQAMTTQARRIQETADLLTRKRLVSDQALLNRLGVPIGLITDPALKDEAMHEAAWNSDLRRYLPGGIRTQEAVGTPAIIQHPAKEPSHD